MTEYIGLVGGSDSKPWAIWQDGKLNIVRSQDKVFKFEKGDILESRNFRRSLPRYIKLVEVNPCSLKARNVYRPDKLYTFSYLKLAKFYETSPMPLIFPGENHRTGRMINEPEPYFYSKELARVILKEAPIINQKQAKLKGVINRLTATITILKQSFFSNDTTKLKEKMKEVIQELKEYLTLDDDEKVPDELLCKVLDISQPTLDRMKAGKPVKVGKTVKMLAWLLSKVSPKLLVRFQMKFVDHHNPKIFAKFQESSLHSAEQ